MARARRGTNRAEVCARYTVAPFRPVTEVTRAHRVPPVGRTGRARRAVAVRPARGERHEEVRDRGRAPTARQNRLDVERRVLARSAAAAPRRGEPHRARLGRAARPARRAHPPRVPRLELRRRGRAPRAERPRVQGRAVPPPRRGRRRDLRRRCRPRRRRVRLRRPDARGERGAALVGGRRAVRRGLPLADPAGELRRAALGPLLHGRRPHPRGVPRERHGHGGPLGALRRSEPPPRRRGGAYARAGRRPRRRRPPAHPRHRPAERRAVRAGEGRDAERSRRPGR